MQNINETLTELDVRGDAGLMSRLATNWEERDGGTWRFQLRPDVKFSDGSAFDAGDVKHSIERAFSDKISCETPRYFSGVEIKADVVDDHTIDITTSPAQPILPLMMSLVTIVPAETPVEFTRNPVGTGPYVLTEWNAGQNIILERRDDYWGDAPKVSKAEYLFRGEAAVRAAMVATGEADIAPVISELDANNPATDFAYLNSETLYMRLDHSIEPISDRRFRQALNMAIDREAFIGTLLPEGTLIATAVVPPSTIGWNAEIVPTAFDRERAKALLEEARASGVNVDAPITLIGRTNNYPNATEVMEALTTMLSEAGFNAKMEMQEVAEFEDTYGKPFAEDRPAQLVTAMHDNARGDPMFSMYFKYHSEGSESGLTDPRVDDLIEKATAASGEERTKIWSELFAYLHDDLVADVMLFHMVGLSRISERLDFVPSIATNSQLQLSEIGFR
jgi:peptide/nickel transport system substrate-binding protein